MDTDPNLPVTLDIDGAARDGTNPDVGADEFVSGTGSSPTFVDSVTTTVASPLSLNLTVTMPTNVAGDMIYVIIGATKSSTTTGPFTVPDASWTEIYDDAFGGASGVRLGVFRKQSTGSEASSYTWTTTGMSRELLKLSGSLVHDYATISDDSPSPNRASRTRRAATSAGIS